MWQHIQTTMMVRLQTFLVSSFHICLVISVIHNDDNTTKQPLDRTGHYTSKVTRWADAAYRYVHSIDCSEVFFTTTKECQYVTSLDKSQMNIYIAEPTSLGRYDSVLPDGGLSKAGSHDAVLVVDPYPDANFGHLVTVFFVDLRITKMVCEVEGGQYLGYGECLTLAIKKRCKNALERRKRRRNFAKRCEINFLPHVSLPEDPDAKQHLVCRDNIPGFASCPTYRPLNETSGIICNPLRDNTKRCETTHETIHTSCRVFEICDQAVMLSGGWTREASLPRHRENIDDMYNMFRRHGFKKKNIKVFFANGAVNTGNTETHEIHPSAFKFALRYHLQKMCTSLHCVDSLVFYMNSPARTDGTSLLWDMDGITNFRYHRVVRRRGHDATATSSYEPWENEITVLAFTGNVTFTPCPFLSSLYHQFSDGIASEKEKYTLAELMSDIEDCAARQVHLIIDQSYSGEIARAIKASKKHKNVLVYASSKDSEYSYGDEFTQHWANFNHTHKCSKSVQKASEKVMTRSRPIMGEGEEGNIKSTIFGAPCDVVPPFTTKELRQDYFGCQNLPTALWLIKFIDEQEPPAAPTI
ncbi:uncharacterized protein LOC135500775 [Lineus longissimus]|uniref:uncharacterized protein LOC135500775 n=1 Tax=Lineus longissimus TaxID=88925 RepID=UPI00315DB114